MKTIKLSEEVYEKLQKVKGKDSFNVALSAMMEHFSTKESYKAFKKVNAGSLAERLEYLIRIIKNIEKTKINPILNRLPTLNDEVVTPLMAEELVKINTNQAREIEALEVQIIELKKQLPNSHNVDIKQLNSLIGWLEVNITKDAKSNDFVIKDIVLQQFISQMKSCLNPL